MKYFKIAVMSILLFTLSSCVNQSNLDVNEILTLLNKNYGYNLEYDSFMITEDNDIIYQKMLNENLLLMFFCDDNNEITQCTVTAKKFDGSADKLGKNVIQCLTGEAAPKKFDNGTAVNGWKIIKIDNELGSTLIINRESNEINTNENPTLKSEINPSAITRPTVSH